MISAMAQRIARGGVRDGEGSSAATAIAVDARNIIEGTDAEYAAIGRACGRQGRDWRLVRQSSFRLQGRTYDQIDVRLQGGGERTFYFDISRLIGGT